MSPTASGEPRAGDVVGAFGEAASQLGSFVSHMLDGNSRRRSPRRSRPDHRRRRAHVTDRSA
jgi:hypothetical protein